MFLHLINLLATIIFIAALEIPSYIQICHRNDPNVSECIKKSIEVLRPRLREGIPELDVPGQEPLRVSDITVHDNSTLQMSVTFINIDVYGSSSFVINDLELDVANFIYDIDLTIPSLHFTGLYRLSTRLLGFPVVGNGQFHANVTDLKTNVVLKGDIVNGEYGRQMYFSDAKLKMQIDDYSAHFGNVINNHPELSDEINKLAKTSKLELLNLALPFIEAKTAEMVLNVANAIVKNFIYDEAFPE